MKIPEPLVRDFFQVGVEIYGKEPFLAFSNNDCDGEVHVQMSELVDLILWLKEAEVWNDERD